MKAGRAAGRPVSRAACVRPDVITIDGPASSGKSTVARRLAGRLGYSYVSSGAIYRAVAWQLAQGAPLAEALAESRTHLTGDSGDPRVLVDGRDVTVALGAPALAPLAAEVSQRPEVRTFADALQRRLAACGPVVVEGRDAGTVVFPGAECKFFLDASLDRRVARRLAEHRARGESVDPEAVQAALASRDQADRTRALAPLVPAPDAVIIDSSGLNVDQVIELMLREVDRRCSMRS